MGFIRSVFLPRAGPIDTSMFSHSPHLNNAFFHSLLPSLLPFHYIRSAYFFPFLFLFLWAFFCTCTRMLSPRIYRKHSTAQHSTAQSNQSKARADQSATRQASRQELATASMSSSISTARCGLKTNK